MFTATTDSTIARLRLTEIVRPGEHLATLHRGELVKYYVGRPGAWRNVTPHVAAATGAHVYSDGALAAAREYETILTLGKTLPQIAELVYRFWLD